MKKTTTQNVKLQAGRAAFALCLLVGALALLSPATARAATNGTWGTVSGNWSDPTKWAGGVDIADGAGGIALYPNPA
jgi:hypothetical protein